MVEVLRGCDAPARSMTGWNFKAACAFERVSCHASLQIEGEKARYDAFLWVADLAPPISANFFSAADL
jgi:hypothetical protein